MLKSTFCFLCFVSTRVPSKPENSLDLCLTDRHNFETSKRSHSLVPRPSGKTKRVYHTEGLGTRPAISLPSQHTSSQSVADAKPRFQTSLTLQKKEIKFSYDALLLHTC